MAIGGDNRPLDPNQQVRAEFAQAANEINAFANQKTGFFHRKKYLVVETTAEGSKLVCRTLNLREIWDAKHHPEKAAAKLTNVAQYLSNLQTKMAQLPAAANAPQIDTEATKRQFAETVKKFLDKQIKAGKLNSGELTKATQLVNCFQPGQLEKASTKLADLILLTHEKKDHAETAKLFVRLPQEQWAAVFQRMSDPKQPFLNVLFREREMHPQVHATLPRFIADLRRADPEASLSAIVNALDRIESAELKNSLALALLDRATPGGDMPADRTLTRFIESSEPMKELTKNALANWLVVNRRYDASPSIVRFKDVIATCSDSQKQELLNSAIEANNHKNASTLVGACFGAVGRPLSDTQVALIGELAGRIDSFVERAPHFKPVRDALLEKFPANKFVLVLDNPRAQVAVTKHIAAHKPAEIPTLLQAVEGVPAKTQYLRALLNGAEATLPDITKALSPGEKQAIKATLVAERNAAHREDMRLQDHYSLKDYRGKWNGDPEQDHFRGVQRKIINAANNLLHYLG